MFASAGEPRAQTLPPSVKLLLEPGIRVNLIRSVVSVGGFELGRVARSAAGDSVLLLDARTRRVDVLRPLAAPLVYCAALAAGSRADECARFQLGSVVTARI